MLTGVLLAIATGLLWTVYGIVLSCCASKKLAVVPYSILQSFVTGALTLPMIDFKAVTARDLGIIAGFIFLAGVLNSQGQYAVHQAMKRGNHAPVWAISQAALIFPFLVGVLLFHNRGSVWQWLGTALVVAGILAPAAKEFRHVGGWFPTALAAVFIFGAVQVLYALPMQLCAFRDAAGLRPIAAAWGGAAGWLVIAAYSRSSLRCDRRTFAIALAMALVSLISLRLFFLALDALTAAKCESIAFPLLTGSNISGFAVYSIFIRREKHSLADKIGFALGLAGLVCIAL